MPEIQQLDFKIKLPIKIANQELERTGATPLPYFLRTQLHPGKQKLSLGEVMMPAEYGGTPDHNRWVAWHVCGMVRLLRVV